MKQIIINNKRENETNAIVDDIDYYRFSMYNWSYTHNRYVATTIKGKQYLLHRLILGVGKGYIVDHINHNKADNRQCNIRICTQSQNLANSHAPNTNTSGYKGVVWAKNKRRYKARVMKDGKMFYCGSYRDAVDAAKAYNVKALELHGEYALLNQI
jgi:hypothetical protein